MTTRRPAPCQADGTCEVVDACDGYVRIIDDGPYDDDRGRRWFSNDVRPEYPTGTVEDLAAAASCHAAP